MKMGLQAENPLEMVMVWIAEKANMIPTILLQSASWGICSRVVFTALKLGIFEAAKDSPQTLEQIAEKTGLNKDSLASTMMILWFLRYFKHKDGRFTLTKAARKFCLKDSPDSSYTYARFCEIMAIWMDHLEEYLKTGQGLNVHETMTEDEWYWYQLSMDSESEASARAMPRITPMPGNPTEMLDIGGSHGLYSVELCKKYPTLKATILELPEAVAKAEPILAKFNMGDRVVYQAGNALTDDFGEKKYDLVLMSSLMHHFTAEENIEVSKKVAKALKPGGYFVIQEWGKPDLSRKLRGTQDVLGVMTDIMFSFMSTSETWSLDTLIDFQKQAGLNYYKVKKYIQMPGFMQVCAKKV